MSRSLSVRLRHRVDIVRPEQVATGLGGFTTALTAVAPGVAAEVIALSGSEAVKEKLLQGIRVYRVTLRWRGDVLQTDQLVAGAETLNIRSAVDPDGRRRELVIHADSEAVVR